MNKPFVPPWIVVAFLANALTGCGSLVERPAASIAYISGSDVILGDTPAVKKRLYAQFKEWKNTKYRLGGMSRSGVDCSGFVYLTFRSKLGVVLPRSTEFLAELGRSVARHELEAGDLVFFKTGLASRHVGVYLEDGKFLHASTSQGVMISRLSESYWTSAYWKAKRVESDTAL
jgi:probable lipoprotein NlpC